MIASNYKFILENFFKYLEDNNLVEKEFKNNWKISLDYNSWSDDINSNFVNLGLSELLAKIGIENSSKIDKSRNINQEIDNYFGSINIKNLKKSLYNKISEFYMITKS